MDSKKKFEKHYLNFVREEVRDFPNGTIQCGENPDLLVESRSETLGIEITRLHNLGTPGGPCPEHQDGERELVVQVAQTIARDRKLDPLMVDVYFSEQKALSKKHRRTIAKQLVDLIEANMPEIDCESSIDNPRLAHTDYPDEIESVHIRRHSALLSHLWQVAGGGIVNENFAAIVEAKVARKNGRLSEYLLKCEVCWLVLVADWTGPSAFLDFSEKMAGVDYETDFARLYFVAGYSGRVVKLATRSVTG